MSDITKRLNELKVGDYVRWGSEIRKVLAVSENASKPGTMAALVGVDDAGEDWSTQETWSVLSDEEVAERKELRAEHRRVWLESRPTYEAKCMAAARRVALAFGKDPEFGEKQMRDVLDGERRAFEEEFGE